MSNSNRPDKPADDIGNLTSFMETRLPGLQEYSIWNIRKMALEQNAIDMSVGITEFSCPTRLAELACSFVKEQFNNIAPVEGILSLREKISGQYFKRYGKLYSPESEVTICAGPVQAVTTAITTVISEGDEVLIFEPCVTTYSPAIRINGGTPVHVPLKEPGFSIEWEDLRKMITSRTRMIIVNTPNDPTGNILRKDDMLHLQRLTSGTGIYIVSDENFAYLAYDQEKHQSVGQFENMAAHSFIISSPGPLFHICGWNLAWCLAPANLTAEFRKIHEYQVSSVASPLQLALDAYIGSDTTGEEITEFYQGKRNYFNRLLKGTPFILQPAQGTYFQLVNYVNLSDEPDIVFAMRLLNEAGVAAVPLSLLMNQKKGSQYLRFCFAKKNETLEEAAERMTTFAGKMRK